MTTIYGNLVIEDNANIINRSGTVLLAGVTSAPTVILGGAAIQKDIVTSTTVEPAYSGSATTSIEFLKYSNKVVAKVSVGGHNSIVKTGGIFVIGKLPGSVIPSSARPIRGSGILGVVGKDITTVLKDFTFIINSTTIDIVCGSPLNLDQTAGNIGYYHNAFDLEWDL